MNKVVAITIGDINGIGIKILFKSWQKKHVRNFILFTDHKILKKNFRDNIIKKNFNIINKKKQKLVYDKKRINIFSYNSSSSEDNTYKSLKYAYKFCKKKICIGILTLPLRKDLIIQKVDKNFIGHTEFFQKIEKKNNANMILFHNRIIISPLTTHRKLKDVSKLIANKEFLYNQIFNLNNSLKIDFNINKPKLIISGFNPHAGENGKLGSEEKNYIIPVVKKLKINKIDIEGPFSADSILINKNLKKYDCFIFIYHDQALIPFKFISQFSGVNFTGNLDIIRTSPDHGTAYNLKNTKDISSKSFLNCYKLINKIYKNRIINETG